MKFIIKLFPEITIKVSILKACDESVVVIRHWDHVKVRIGNELYRSQVADALTCMPGIYHILAVKERPPGRICTIFTYKRWRCVVTDLVGESFYVRVKRCGTHDFTSQGVERYVGGILDQNVENTRVKLTRPGEMVLLEIDNDRLLLITECFEGFGGFAIGTEGMCCR